MASIENTSNRIQWPSDVDPDPHLAALLESLPGIDAALGREYMLNSDRLYKEMLQRFHFKRCGFVADFEATLALGNARSAQTLVHNLCGCAGAIAAQGVERSSRQLERAVYRDAPLEEIRAALAELDKQLDIVLDGLEVAGLGGEAELGLASLSPVSR